MPTPSLPSPAGRFNALSRPPVQASWTAGSSVLPRSPPAPPASISPAPKPRTWPRSFAKVRSMQLSSMARQVLPRALKIAYAAYTKGSPLFSSPSAHWPSMKVSIPRFFGSGDCRCRKCRCFGRGRARVRPKAWRFRGEMEEIADTFASAGLPDGSIAPQLTSTGAWQATRTPISRPRSRTPPAHPCRRPQPRWWRTVIRTTIHPKHDIAPKKSLGRMWGDEWAMNRAIRHMS